MILKCLPLRPAKTLAVSLWAGFVLLCLALPAPADNAYEARIYRSLRSSEAIVAEAIGARNGASLRRQSSKIGAIVDRAFARRERDRTKLSDCEKAAAYLAHIAIYAERGLFYKRQGSEFGEIVLEGIPREIKDYARSMKACARLLEVPLTQRPPFARSLNG